MLDRDPEKVREPLAVIVARRPLTLSSSALSIPMNKPHDDWGFQTEPEPPVDGGAVNS